MLQKCANPACLVPFRSLREGKLFLSDTRPAGPETPGATRRQPRRREHFWLCQTCSELFTLHFDIQAGMLTVPLNHDPKHRLTAQAG